MRGFLKGGFQKHYSKSIMVPFVKNASLPFSTDLGHKADFRQTPSRTAALQFFNSWLWKHTLPPAQRTTILFQPAQREIKVSPALQIHLHKVSSIFMDFHMQWILRMEMPMCEMEHTLCSKVRAAVNFLRFSHRLQNILSCVWLYLWHRVGNLGDKFFMNQEILARVLKIFWSDIFTSFYNPERKQVALQHTWGFPIPCSGSWSRAQGWVVAV